MKIVKEPSVYLIGSQQIRDENLDRFLEDHDYVWKSDSEVPAEIIAEASGRLCYLSFNSGRPGGNKAYLGHIIESLHGSVLSHCVWNFVITGVSRSLVNELIRHSVGTGFSQLSQRYVDESDAEYVKPPLIQEIESKINSAEIFKGYSALVSMWEDAIKFSHDSYVSLVNELTVYLDNHRPDLRGTDKRKMARQTARSVLPNATETKLSFSVNARAARNILEQRANRHADIEIRIFANKLYDVLIKEAPNIFGDYRKIELPDGTFELETNNRKV
jgi:thymidylate synthase (FAD)